MRDCGIYIIAFGFLLVVVMHNMLGFRPKTSQCIFVILCGIGFGFSAYTAKVTGSARGFTKEKNPALYGLGLVAYALFSMVAILAGILGLFSN